jgi:hypothetical protein
VIDSLCLREDKTVTVQFTNKKAFIWRADIKVWSLIDNALYEMDNDHQTQSIDGSHDGLLTVSEETANKQFMEGLLRPPQLAPMHQLEYNTIFYRKHRPDTTKYGLALLDYVKELVRQRQDNRLRIVLINHFIDNSK